jgi:copper homeostasis protein
MLEIACFNASSAIAAAHAGADRIELCRDYAAGGLTPSLSTLERVRNQTSIPINVMIRPRGGNDFNYTAEEVRQMEDEIALLKPLATGFVFGILRADSRVDEARNARLVECAAPRVCTFHRAVDEAADVGEAVEAIAACGFKSVLTSGGEASAALGAESIRRMREAYGQRVELIAGGVRSNNIEEVKRETGVPWVHSAAITGAGEDVDADEVRRMKDVLIEMQA